MNIDKLPLKNIELNKGLYITETRDVDDAVLVYNKNADDSYWNYGYVTYLDEDLLLKIKKYFQGKGLPAAIYITEKNETKGTRRLLKQNGFKLDYQDSIMVFKGEQFESERKFKIKEVKNKDDERDYLDVYRKVFCEEGEDVYSGMSDGYLKSVEDYFKKYSQERRIDLVVYEDQKPVGIVSIMFDKEYVLIMGIAVLDEFRKKGISTSFISEAIKRFKDKTIFLSTEAGSINEEIYKKMGFETVLIDKCYIENEKNEK